MNNRIQELAEQAGLLGPSSRVGKAHDATEKFAELLIQECLDLVEYNSHGAAKDIKEHFGVTE